LWEPEPVQLTNELDTDGAAMPMAEEPIVTAESASAHRYPNDPFRPPADSTPLMEPPSPYAPPSKPIHRISLASRTGTGTSGLGGIAVTSAIFAAMHGPQWPAPIALFVLSFVIGYVYQRTGSLIAAICMHATFNGFSTLLLLGFLLVPQSA